MGIYQRRKKKTDDDSRATELDVKLRHDPSRKSYSVVAPGTPLHEIDLSEIPFLQHAEESTKGALKRTKRVVKTRRFLLPLFLTIGFALASIILAPLPNGLADLPDFDLSGLGAQWEYLFEDLTTRISDAKLWFSSRGFKTGLAAAEEGLTADSPLMLFPGVITTGLESWSTDADSLSFFRQRIWGTHTMFKSIFADKNEWIRQISLDSETGLDPPGVRVRPAQGLDAASMFMQGLRYWVWRPIIENLACINYDTNNLEMAAYDWRLAYSNLENRDHYFTRVKSRIEMNKKIHGKKTTLVSHSMGGTVLMYFMKWVEAEGYGGGGNTWVEDHIENLINISGTLLGVPKGDELAIARLQTNDLIAMTALLSGEMKDTVELNPAGAYALEKFFSKEERADLFRSWFGIAGMWMKGGDAVWGNSTYAPDDPENTTDTYGRFLSIRDNYVMDPNQNKTLSRHNYTITDANNYVLTNTPKVWQKMMHNNYSYGIEIDEEKLDENNYDPTKWSNPLESRLPNAPSMSIYCIYGVGKPTERSYYYTEGPKTHQGLQSDMEVGKCEADDCDKTEESNDDLPLTAQNAIDNDLNLPEENPQVSNGVKFGQGDGTVSLMSLGSMCSNGWRRPDRRYNPGNSRIVSYEIDHKPDSMDLRGGDHTGDHVDILGSTPLNELILKIAAGKGNEIQDHFVSNIREISDRIDWDLVNHASDKEII
ncbi:phospholipid/diacylglycerol acyltransferase [Wallemia mellicola]|uniref:Phospholipid/diacylglycerol acyltransferase n=1 Tax=Wallemia mellicola TaxID=1708541 RepID=A0A4T0SII8_9BASI|nr:phospholipid/diacylglycerol acyltransferase [Wallemia mellicola]TIC51416.1 phospholipid/diacylglycerol acyltransferase [Wallemia mellicola]TIC69714.1 phospholipid/diacylglycerol acyltransferase [Wallemia mellicola]